MQIDFNKFKKKYSLLTDKDITFLSVFFSDSEVDNYYADVLKNNKQMFFRIFVVLSACSLLLFGLYYYGLFSSGIIVRLMAICFCIVLFLFSTGGEWHKEKIVGKFLNKIDKDIQYDLLDQFFEHSIPDLANKKKILRKFDKIMLAEDSIKYEFFGNNSAGAFYDNKFSILKDFNLLINGIEVQTYKKHKFAKKGYEYSALDWCYIFKVSFKNNNINIGDNILISTEKINRGKTFTFIILLFLIGFFSYFFKDDLLDLSYRLLGYKDNSPFILGSLIIGFCLTLMFLFKKWIFGPRVRFGIDKFERNLDVYSEDENATRTILTSQFRDIILQFSKNIKNRHHKISFSGNEFFVSIDVKGSYLDQGIMLSKYKFVEKYLMFYSDLKNMIEFAYNIQLFLTKNALIT